MSTGLNENDYKQLYLDSINNPVAFWTQMAKDTIVWSKPWKKVLTGNFKEGNVRWFAEGELNVSFNCIDRHLENRANQYALIWQGEKPQHHKKITYQELYDAVCKFANLLKKLAIQKGDCVCIYLPMIPEAIFAMLACTRIGAIHNVVFSGFSPNALQERLLNTHCKLVITTDFALRNGKYIPLKENVNQALVQCPEVKNILVIRQTQDPIEWQPERDIDYFQAIKNVETTCQPEPLLATDPLFVLYTSGSTGKPKGILHATGGYAVYTALTFQTIFNYQAPDIFWCTADIGWITGHSYSVYGPLLNGATSFLFEGMPLYPTPKRIWEIIDEFQINILYTAPTLLRMLMRLGNENVKSSSRASLKLLGSVGEPINPSAWQWYFQCVGESRCPIVDTWWQTETGGIMISPLPHLNHLKPGAASKPFLGIVPALLDDQGNILKGENKGNLVIKAPWPGMMIDVYGDHPRFLNSYFKPYPGFYFTGDFARRDAEGDYWISGRMDDVLNVAGHRLSTAEIENALVSHPAIAEAAVVSIPHDIKGEGIYAFVTPRVNIKPNLELVNALKLTVKKEISGIAMPDVIHWADALPKTRSGKIMRRLLKKIANKDTHDLGDISTIADPCVIAKLIDVKDLKRSDT